MEPHPPVVVLDIAPEPPTAFTEQQIQETVPALLQPPPRPKRRHRNRKTNHEDDDEEFNQAETLGQASEERQYEKRKKNSGQTIKIAPVATACPVKNIPDIFDQVMTQILQVKPTAPFDKYAIQNLVITHTLNVHRYQAPAVEQAIITACVSEVLEDAQGKFTSANNNNRLFEADWRDPAADGLMIVKYHQLMDSEVEKQKRSYRTDIRASYTWTKEALQRFKIAFKKYGYCPTANKNIAQEIGHGIHANHVAYFKVRLRRLFEQKTVAEIVDSERWEMLKSQAPSLADLEGPQRPAQEQYIELQDETEVEELPAPLGASAMRLAVAASTVPVGNTTPPTGSPAAIPPPATTSTDSIATTSIASTIPPLIDVESVATPAPKAKAAPQPRRKKQRKVDPDGQFSSSRSPSLYSETYDADSTSAGGRRKLHRRAKEGPAGSSSSAPVLIEDEPSSKGEPLLVDAEDGEDLIEMGEGAYTGPPRGRKRKAPTHSAPPPLDPALITYVPVDEPLESEPKRTKLSEAMEESVGQRAPSSPRSLASSVWSHAILSRLLVFGIVVATVTVVSPYDTSARIAYDLDDQHTTPLDSVVKHLFYGFGSWDGIYFTRIASSGYEFEQTSAFFPLYPALITLIKPILWVVPISETSRVLVVGWALSNLAFCLAAVQLYRLGERVLQSKQIAYLAAIMFCYNPASIFFSATYTESVFALFAFTGMYAVYDKREWRAAVWFSLATLTRSNGLVLAGFVGFRHLILGRSQWYGAPAKTISMLVSMALQISLVAAPLIGFQCYLWSQYCSSAQPRPWCSALPPFAYGFVQSHYWNVGFLRYWTVQQLPNFFLALPILSLSFLTVWRYVSHDWQRIVRYILQGKSQASCAKASAADQAFVLNDQLLPFIVHLGFLVSTALLSMHVQVATRFLASQCPVLFWFSASLFYKRDRLSKAVSWYFGIYFVLGSCLFSSFYPWT